MTEMTSQEILDQRLAIDNLDATQVESINRKMFKAFNRALSKMNSDTAINAQMGRLAKRIHKQRLRIRELTTGSVQQRTKEINVKAMRIFKRILLDFEQATLVASAHRGAEPPTITEIRALIKDYESPTASPVVHPNGICGGNGGSGGGSGNGGSANVYVSKSAGNGGNGVTQAAALQACADLKTEIEKLPDSAFRKQT